MFKRVRTFFSSKDVNDRAKIAEDIIFGKSNIEVDQGIAEATARLAEAFCKTNSPGIVDAASFLFVKLPGDDGVFRIWSKRLTIDDRILLNENPSLANDPKAVADLLGLRPIAFDQNTS